MCTVKGDLHDIGKNLVIMMLEGAGFEVLDMGVDINVDSLIATVKEIKPDVLGLSGYGRDAAEAVQIARQLITG